METVWTASGQMRRCTAADKSIRKPLMECVTQGIWGICSAQINLILSDGTEELRKVQASIHERFYKSFLIGDLRMGLDAVREHYDTIEQALGEQSLYDWERTSPDRLKRKENVMNLFLTLAFLFCIGSVLDGAWRSYSAAFSRRTTG